MAQAPAPRRHQHAQQQPAPAAAVANRVCQPGDHHKARTPSGVHDRDVAQAQAEQPQRQHVGEQRGRANDQDFAEDRRIMRGAR